MTSTEPIAVTPTEAEHQLALELAYAVRDAEGLTARTEARVAIAQALADQRAELVGRYEAALAEEREKARAPFLALAVTLTTQYRGEEWDAEGIAELIEEVAEVAQDGSAGSKGPRTPTTRQSEAEG